MLNFKDHSSALLSPRSASGGAIIGHPSTRYNENAENNMIGDIEEEEDKEEEDADKDERSLDPSSRPKSKVSNSGEAQPGSSQLPESILAPEASLSAAAHQYENIPSDIINFQNN